MQGYIRSLAVRGTPFPVSSTNLDRFFQQFRTILLRLLRSAAAAKDSHVNIYRGKVVMLRRVRQAPASIIELLVSKPGDWNSLQTVLVFVFGVLYDNESESIALEEVSDALPTIAQAIRVGNKQ